MPTEVTETIRVLSQQAFGEIAYEIMNQAFQIHNDLGRFFEEDSYQRELGHVLGPRARTEARIRVKHLDFCKTYFIDLLVDQGAIFELKTVDHLQDEHRAQLLNYLLLCECRHGKLINFRPDRIEHEFMNTTLTGADRTAFEVDDSAWDYSVAQASEISRLIQEFLRDWGTGLDLRLYVDALTHFLGGEQQILREIDIVSEGRYIGRQTARLVGVDTSFKFTALPSSLETFESHARRFLKHTNLNHVLWINVTLRNVTFKTLTKADRKTEI
jgi:GxxExxY protein